MPLKPALHYTGHWTRGGFVWTDVTVRALALRAMLIQLRATLVEPFEMCVAFLWRVCVRRKACLKCTSLLRWILSDGKHEAE